MSLESKREEAVRYHTQLINEQRRIGIEIERTVGRITTLNELIEEEELAEHYAEEPQEG